MTRRALAGAVLLGLALPGGIAAYVQALPRLDGWHAIAWPFPRDGWPAGRAYRCDAAACGETVEVYVRPKIGFCNCDTGVADDDEVDRVADLDLISPQFRPLQSGQAVRVAEMPGRIRDYELTMAGGARRSAVGIAVSRRCDLMVAVAQGSGTSAEVKRQALAWLASEPAVTWMASSMQAQR